MRSLLVPALLLASVMPLPGASAAEPFFTDAAGDVECVATAADTPLPGAPCNVDATRGLDLVSLALAETEDEISFTVGFASMDTTPRASDAQIAFDWSGRTFFLAMGYFDAQPIDDSGGAHAYLMAEDGSDQEWIAELAPPVVTPEAATIAANVPKAYLADRQGRIPGRADAIEVTQVISESGSVGFFVVGAHVADAMPDEPSPKPFTLALGDISEGDIELRADERARVSNGGATTFVYRVDVRNPGEAEQEYVFAAADLPEGWNATVQSPVRVASKETKTLSVLLSVPFAHEHGGFSAFNLTARSATDPATNARMRLGVLHTPIPQPAGHHSELYLHAQRDDDPISSVFDPLFPFRWGWLNTQSDHADDGEFVTPSDGSGIFFGPDEESTRFYLGLDPGLLVGLDFDLDRLATLQGEIVGGRSETVDLRADLWYWSEESDAILLAEGEPTQVALDLQTPTPFEMTLTPTPESDYIGYTPSSYLFLEVSLPRGATETLTPSMRPKLLVEPFKLSLPLNEYHDRLTGATEAANAVEVLAKGLVEKVGQPGTVLTNVFEVRNPGETQTFVFDLAGNDVSQAALVPRGEFEIAGGASREATVAVEIPMSANAGEEFEVLLFVHSRDDPSKMAVARTKTRVTADASEAMPDESAALLAAQARENETPFPAVPALALAVALALALRRR